MAITALIVITLASISWSLWIRRLTWHCRWEVAATLNIALQGCAVALISPLASATVGVALHRLTGEWNLQNYLGHDCYIVAASAIVYNALADSVTTAPFRCGSSNSWTAGDAVYSVVAGHFLAQPWQPQLCARFLRDAHRLLVDRVLVAALCNPHVSAAVRRTRAAHPAKRSAIEARCRCLSVRDGIRDHDVCGAVYHRAGSPFRGR